jgi:hypothetical protein
VQKRLSRKKVHRAFDDLLASAGSAVAIEVPTDRSDKMSQLTDDPAFGGAETARRKPLPIRVVHALVHASNKHQPEDDPQPTPPQEKPR